MKRYYCRLTYHVSEHEATEDERLKAQEDELLRKADGFVYRVKRFFGDTITDIRTQRDTWLEENGNPGNHHSLWFERLNAGAVWPVNAQWLLWDEENHM